MKIKARIMLLILLAYMLVFPVAPAFAADKPVTLSINVSKYVNGKYEEADRFNAGEIAVVNVVSESDFNIGGIRLNIGYTAQDLTVKGDKVFAIPDPEEKSESYVSVKDSKLIAFWYTTSKTTNIHKNEVVFTVCFLVNEATKNPSTKITAKVEELFDSDNSDYTLADITAKNIYLNSASIPVSILEAFRKLETITVNSLPDIVAAEEKYNQLTSLQIRHLMSNYPTEYGYVINARNKYNALFDDTGDNKQLLEEAAQKFKNDYSDVLALDVNAPDLLEHSERVEEALQAFKILNSGVKALLKTEGSHIGALQQKIDEIIMQQMREQEAKEEAQQFIDNYAELWSAAESEIRKEENFSFYLSSILNAKSEFDKELENDTKGYLTEQKQMLDKLYDLIKKIETEINNNNKISEECEGFLKKWIKITRLTSRTVSVSDKTALEMMLEDFENLSSEAKDALAVQKSKAESLLKQIEGMNTVEQTVKETVVEYQTLQLPGNTVVQTVEVPAETDAQNQTSKKVKQVNNIFHGMPKIVLWLLGILAFLTLLLIYPITVFIKDYKSIQGGERGWKSEQKEYLE